MDFAFLGQFFMGLKLEDFKEAREAALADQISTYFTKPNEKLQYLGLAGVGRHGGALLFNERDDDGKPVRKIIVKYSLTEEADADLKNEAQWLNHLKGAEHIVQVLTLPGASVNVTGTGRRPTVALEFIPHGTIHEFQQRFARFWENRGADGTPTLMPARFLWCVFLCMVRQIAAMSFPPRESNPTAENEREFPRTGAAICNLTQNSPHSNNFVFDVLQEGDSEHDMIPRVKMIDFGRGKLEQKYGDAYMTNVWGAAYAITCLALPFISDEKLRPAISEVELTEPIVVGRESHAVIYTEASTLFTDMPLMDWKLRDTIARCMGTHPVTIPTLPELLAICEDSVANRRLADFDLPDQPFLRDRESDRNLQALVQHLVYDADADAQQARASGRPLHNGQLGSTLLGLGAAGRAAPAPAPANHNVVWPGGGEGSAGGVGVRLARVFAERLASSMFNARPAPAPAPTSEDEDDGKPKTLYEGFKRRINNMRKARKGRKRKPQRSPAPSVD
ncbi:hypothetical protein GGR53DRAFT_467827 [Hypoxylon sp. FL1150]|nr:hypothetical protein GGR53DRAFT_467827 [Hypoxylon sp. FL1150]